MRYWAYVNNQTLGPYELAEIPKIEGFTPDLLICPEYPPEGKQQEWVPASSVLEQQSAAESPVSAPSPEASAAEASPAAQPASQEPPQQAAPLQASMMPAPGVELVSAADAISGDSGKASQFSLGAFEIEQFPQSQPAPTEYKPEPLLQQAFEPATPAAQEPAPASDQAQLSVSPVIEPEPLARQQPSPVEYNPSPLPAAEREIQLETFPSPEPAVRSSAVQASAPAAYSPSPMASQSAPQVSDSQLVAEVNKSVSEIENSLAEANKMLSEYKAVAQSVPAPSGAQMETQLQSVMGELNSFKKEVHALIEERIKLEQEILSGLATLGVQPAAGGISAQHIEQAPEYAEPPVAMESAADAAMSGQETVQPVVEAASGEVPEEQPSMPEAAAQEQQPAASSSEDSFDVPAFEPAAQAQPEPEPQPAASMEAAILSAPEETPAAPAPEAAASGVDASAPAAQEPQSVSAAEEKPAADKAAKRKKLIMIGAVVAGVIVLFLILGLLQLLPSAVNPFAKKKLPVPVMTPVTPEAVPAKADIKRDADMIAVVKAWKASSGTTVEEMATASGNVPQWKAQQDASGAWQVSATYSSGGVSYAFSVSGDGKVAPANKDAQNLIARFSNSPATLKDKPLPQQARQSAPVSPAKAPVQANVPAAPQQSAMDAASVQPGLQQNPPAAPKAARQRRPRGTAKKPAAVTQTAPAPAPAASAAQPAAPLQQEEIIEEEVVEEP